MNIIVSNNTDLSNKHVRFIKWKFHNIKDKFKHLLYIEVFLNMEGQAPKNYRMTIRLGVRGNDIIIQNKSENLMTLFQKSYDAVHRCLAKTKSIQERGNHKW